MSWGEPSTLLLLPAETNHSSLDWRCESCLVVPGSSLHPFGQLWDIRDFKVWLLWMINMERSFKIKNNRKSNPGKQSGVIIPHVSDGESREKKAREQSQPGPNS